MSPQASRATSSRLLIRYLPPDITALQLRDVIRERWPVDPDEIQHISNITVLRGFSGSPTSVSVPSTGIIEISPLTVPDSQHVAVHAIIGIFDGENVFTGEAACSVEISPVPSSFPQLMRGKQRQKQRIVAGTIEEDEAYKRFCARLRGESIQSEDDADEPQEKEKCNNGTAVDGDARPLTALVEALVAQDLVRRHRTERKGKKNRKDLKILSGRSDRDAQLRAKQKQSKKKRKARDDPTDQQERRRDKRSGVEGDVEEKVPVAKKVRRRRKDTKEKKSEVGKKEREKRRRGTAQEAGEKRDTKKCGRRDAKKGAKSEGGNHGERIRAPGRRGQQVRIISRQTPAAN